MRITSSLDPAMRKMLPNQARISLTITLDGGPCLEKQKCVPFQQQLQKTSNEVCEGPARMTEAFLSLAKDPHHTVSCQ